MRRSIVFLNVAAAVVLAGTARADFVLSGTEHVNVTTSHLMGELWDSSTADVLAEGYVNYLDAHNSSSVHVSGGSIDCLWANDTSTVNVLTNGRVSNDLYAYNDSTVNVSGGGVFLLSAFDTSSVDISGGSVNYLRARGTSTVNVSGGRISGWLCTYDTSSVDISGGSVNYPTVYGTSSVHVSGGNISGDLNAYSNSSVVFHGYDFRAIGGLTLAGDEVLGTGALTGKWFDGTPWAVAINENAPTATIRAAMLAPSVASFAGDPTLTYDIDFGTVNPGDSVPGEPFAIWNLADPKWSMNLDLLSIVGSGDTGPLTANLSPFTDLAAGQSHSFTAWIDTSVPGDFAASYVLNLSDRLGTDQTLTLNLHGSVVPEPSTLVLLATGTLGLTVGWWRRRRRAARGWPRRFSGVGVGT